MEMKKYLSDIDDKKLKLIIEVKDAYNEGKLSLADARAKLRKNITSILPEEIAVAEQYLKEFDEDECKKEDIQKMLELFDGFMETSRPNLPDDHPIMCYYRENDALRKILLEIKDLVQYPIIKNQWLELYERLNQYKIHLSRKQNQLYSILEKKGFDRPTTTMWTLDNFIRDEINDAKKLLDSDKDDEFIEMQNQIVLDIEDLMQKEETVLYPTSLAMINADEFEEMKLGDAEIGFAWIEVKNQNSEKVSKNATAEMPSDFITDLAKLVEKYKGTPSEHTTFDVATGKLTLEQINLIYKHMPVDLSYVNENEIVCFYSDTDHRVFPRSKNVIGRNVENCHPRKSVHVVKEIVEKFKSGEQDSAEFWINKPDLFIYIYYVAVRDEKGQFKGILEMMQDCTHIRSLQGSQTLLTWEKLENQAQVNDTSDSENASENAANLSNIENNHPNDKCTSFEINENTLLKDIFARYPTLKEKMPEINEKFKMLSTPLARIMLPKATIKMASERANIPIDFLIAEIKKRI